MGFWFEDKKPHTQSIILSLYLEKGNLKNSDHPDDIDNKKIILY